MKNPAEETQAISRRFFLKLAVASAAATTIVVPTSAYASTTHTKTFADSLGRNVRIAGNTECIIPLGIGAQALMTTLYPNGLLSVVKDIGEDKTDYLQAGLDTIVELPAMTSEIPFVSESTLASWIEQSNPDFVLDAGLPYSNQEQNLDFLWTKTNVPTFFIDLSFGNLPAAYRTLGHILGCVERAEKLANYVESVYEQTKALLSKDCKIFYAPKKNGITLKKSIQLQLDAIAFLGATPVISPYDSKNRAVDVSKLNEDRANLIVFDDTSVLESFAQKKGEAYDIWEETEPVIQDCYAISPALMHSWLGSPVLLQTMGLLWLCAVANPKCGISLAEEAAKYYRLFYGLDKPIEFFHSLIGENQKEENSHE